MGSVRSRLADPVADLDLVEAPELSDRPRRDGWTLDGGSVLEHRDGGHLILEITAEAQPIARPERPREHPDVHDLLAARAAFDLEDRTRDRAVGIAGGCRQQLGNAGHQLLHTRTGDRRAEEDGMEERPIRLSCELGAKPVMRDVGLVLDVRRQNSVVALRKHLRQPCPKTGIVGTEEREGRSARAELARGSHRNDRRRQALRDRVQHALVAGSGAVDLVHEHQRRNAQPLQRAHQHARLRLHTLDCRDHENRAVEHAQHSFHLGDEVRMARRVDQVDVDVFQCERRNGRLDRDPTLPLQRQRVGLRASGVDAANFVDHAGFVQQAFGESCLTGVYMRQDSEVQLFLRHASYPPNRSQRPSGWT